MRANVRREVPSRQQGQNVVKHKHTNCNLTIADGGVMLSGPSHGHIADGQVHSISTAYKGADHHISMRVDVFKGGERTFGYFVREYWTVEFLQEEVNDATESD